MEVRACFFKGISCRRASETTAKAFGLGRASIQRVRDGEPETWYTADANNRKWTFVKVGRHSCKMVSPIGVKASKKDVALFEEVIGSICRR